MTAIRRNLKFALPVGLTLIIGAFLYVGLTLEPSKIPSALISERIPTFSLPAIEGRERGLTSQDIIDGAPALVNAFASWCVACRAEHPLFMRLKEDGVPIYGINYKDRPKDVRKWLDELGDPFTQIGADFNGRTSIEWGVYGIPETFVVDREGRIVRKFIGALSREDVNNTVLPLIEELRAK